MPEGHPRGILRIYFLKKWRDLGLCAKSMNKVKCTFITDRLPHGKAAPGAPSLWSIDSREGIS